MEAFLPIIDNSESFTPHKESFSSVFPRETCEHPYDLTLVVEHGKQFRAHKDVLSAASPFFEKLLNSDMKEAKEGIVQLEMFNDSVMAATLEFIYTGGVRISTQEIAEGLIVMADYLFLPNLKPLAEEIVIRKLKASNCISTCYFAEKYQCNELVSKIKNFILANFTAVAKTDEFLSMSSEEVEGWISSDEVVIGDEEDVFKIVLTWIEHDKDERKKYFANLFRQVRLAYVSRDFLCSEILSNDLVKSKKACLSLVMDAVETKNSKNHRNPRKSQQTSFIVAFLGKYILCYSPREDQWYLLGENSISNSKDFEVFSRHGKLYFVKLSGFIHSELLCYDPLSDSWMRQQLEETRYVRQIFVRNEDEVYTLVSDGCLRCENLSCLCYARKKYVSFLRKYNPESNEWQEISSFDLGSKEGICVVVKDNFIYFIGGGVREQHRYKNLPDVHRYDVNQNQWDKVADVQEGRMFACGAATKDRLFIAGGLDREGMTSNTCEVYNETTDEWHFIANLNANPSFLSSMVCCDGKVYVLGGCYDNDSHHAVECYDPDNDEWKVKTKLPFRFPVAAIGQYYLQACSMTIFTRSLNKLPMTLLSRSGLRGDKTKCVMM
ncbi:kelch-like protein 12 [Orbicella faveolata]|uniref:kelch-like protein 12 n=1 Tax=Orbicella faveolata TaxID=48498 RepID=UPI0009E60FC9|nr:kelch-like protein 12 [Orbicella faveolata]